MRAKKEFYQRLASDRETELALGVVETIRIQTTKVVEFIDFDSYCFRLRDDRFIFLTLSQFADRAMSDEFPNSDIEFSRLPGNSRLLSIVLKGEIVDSIGLNIPEPKWKEGDIIQGSWSDLVSGNLDNMRAS